MPQPVWPPPDGLYGAPSPLSTCSAPGELEILGQAARQADELARLTDALADQPTLVRGSTGQVKVNPLFAAITSHRRTLDSLIQSLALPMPEESSGRPRSATARRAASTRWERTGRRELRAVADGET